MNRKLLFLPIFVLSIFLVATISQADVVLEDIQAAIQISNAGPFNSSTIETGVGNSGDYVITTCGVTDPNNSNVFSDPTPGTWTELDTGMCGGTFGCIGGTWGRFVNQAASGETLCSWTGNNDVLVFAAASMRFSLVNQDDPIIGIACDTGQGSAIATAPSIETEAGSYVVRSFNFNPDDIPFGSNPQTFTSFDPNNTFGEGFAFNTFQIIVSRLDAEFFEDAGPTGTFDLTFADGIPIQWRACTIALRMGPPPSRNVPTMSEWGLIAFAGFAGIAGVWYLRRRQATS